MPHELQAYLWHVEEAADHILQYTSNRSFTDYEQDSMLRAAVYRKFAIIGEALKQMVQHYPEQASWVATFEILPDFAT